MTLTQSELRDDIDEVTTQVWTNILSLDVVRGGPADAAPVTVSSAVHIIGEWNGAVVLTMTSELATVIATTMFCMDAAELEESDVNDAVGEMANMIGGNIKSLLPGPSQLSMPTVAAGEQQPVFPGSEVIDRLEFTAAGQPFNVTLLRERSGAIDNDAERNDR
ncbi:MAG: chemotaxis protein CheX [Acidimicrobiales bacterium]